MELSVSEGEEGGEGKRKKKEERGKREEKVEEEKPLVSFLCEVYNTNAKHALKVLLTTGGEGGRKEGRERF